MASSNCKLQKRDLQGKYDVCTRRENFRISEFPEEILSNILSFLPTKEAARTSILSKQWKHAWTFAASIEIQDHSLYESNNYKNSEAIRVRFAEFVDKLLRLNNVPCLRKFSLGVCENYGASKVREWLRHAFNRDAEELSLDFNVLYLSFELPLDLVHCNKLVYLKLSHEFILNVPASARLPNLKILHLDQVRIASEESMKNLLEFCCPVLKELDISTHICPNMRNLYFRSSSLKSLKFDTRGAWHCGKTLGIVVNVKKLERIDISCDLSKRCNLNSLSSLVEAKLDLFDCSSESDVWEAAIFHGNKLVNILKKMSKTQSMCLSRGTMKSLGHARRLDNMPVFHKLTRLELHVHEYCWKVFRNLLECSPNLITFVLFSVPAAHYDHRERWHQQFIEPKRLMLYLEDVRLINFKGCIDGMKMVKYFLENATILKKMSIQASSSNNEDIQKEILAFPRCSTACQITFK